MSIGLVALVQIWRGQANLGIDFAGGTALQLKFEKPLKMEQARKALEKSGFQDSELQHFTEGNKLLIQVKKPFEAKETKVSDQIVRLSPRNSRKQVHRGKHDRDRPQSRQEPPG